MTLFPTIKDRVLSFEALQSLHLWSRERAALLQDIGFQREAERVLGNALVVRHGCPKHSKEGQRQVLFVPLRRHRLCPRSELETWYRLARYLTDRMARAGETGPVCLELEVGPVKPESADLRQRALELRGLFSQLIMDRQWIQAGPDYFWNFEPRIADKNLHIVLELWVSGMGRTELEELTQRLSWNSRSMKPNTVFRAWSEGKELWQFMKQRKGWSGPWGACQNKEIFEAWARAFSGRQRFHLRGGEVRGRLLQAVRSAQPVINNCSKCERPYEALESTSGRSIDTHLADAKKKWPGVSLSFEVEVETDDPNSPLGTLRPELTFQDGVSRRQLCEAFGHRLEETRQKTSYSRASVAEVVGASVAAYQSWERGLNYPRVDSLIRLCQLFNVSSDYLLFGDEESEGPGEALALLRQKIQKIRSVLDE